MDLAITLADFWMDVEGPSSMNLLRYAARRPLKNGSSKNDPRPVPTVIGFYLSEFASAQRSSLANLGLCVIPAGGREHGLWVPHPFAFFAKGAVMQHSPVRWRGGSMQTRYAGFVSEKENID